ncbi:MAG: PfkB family carbohydrate kinase, partial [Planctomycetales bacterium]
MAHAVTFGEIMLRLATPGHQRFVQANRFEATYAGAEASVAVSLAQMGHQASYVTALPDGPLGDAALGHTRFYGVDVSHAVRDSKGRLGVYFLEHGASQRPSKVIYDRGDSTISRTSPDAYNWKTIL